MDHEDGVDASTWRPCQRDRAANCHCCWRDLPGALEAALALQSSIRPEAFNPCWMLCGERDALAYLDLSTSGRPHVEPLEPGIHILENRPLGPSPKADFVRALLGQPPCELDALTLSANWLGF